MNLFFDCMILLIDCMNLFLDCTNLLLDCMNLLIDCMDLLIDCMNYFNTTRTTSSSMITNEANQNLLTKLINFNSLNYTEL